MLGEAVWAGCYLLATVPLLRRLPRLLTQTGLGWDLFCVFVQYEGVDYWGSAGAIVWSLDVRMLIMK